MGATVPERSLRQAATVFLIVCALVLPLVLVLGMTKRLGHDEHQHIAAGALLARDGLLPYRDFPHFHTPYLAFVYGLLFQGTDHLMLAARLFSVACATAMVGLLGSVAYGLFYDRGKRLAGFVCAGTVLLCLTAGVFGETTGRAWNHEPGLLFALLAFLAHAAGIARQQNAWYIASGVLLGVSIGLRLTFAPLVAPFGLALFLYAPPPRWRPRPVLCFAAGLFIGMLGLLWLFAVAPEQTFFGNFEFPGINIIYRVSTGSPRTMTLLKKLRYFWKETMFRELPLVIVSLLPVIVARCVGAASRRSRFETGFVFISLPFVLMGCFAPSPLFPQYFYPLVPFLLLAALYGLAGIPSETAWFRRLLVVGAICVLVSVVAGRRAYGRFRQLASMSEWAPIKMHRETAKLRAQIRPGRVLTLVPLYPLEAGLSIYPPFATGPFAWRVAPYVGVDKAARMGIVTPATLAAVLDAEPPAGILLGFEGRHEIDLGHYAESRGYEVVSSFNRELWVPTAKSGK
jgi:hypothetical protein